MRLGVCGMVPDDFRDINDSHLNAIRKLNLTAVAFHGNGDILRDVTSEECDGVRKKIAAAELDLPQFGIGFPDKSVTFPETVPEKEIEVNKSKINIGRELFQFVIFVYFIVSLR